MNRCKMGTRSCVLLSLLCQSSSCAAAEARCARLRTSGARPRSRARQPHDTRLAVDLSGCIDTPGSSHAGRWVIPRPCHGPCAYSLSSAEQCSQLSTQAPSSEAPPQPCKHAAHQSSIHLPLIQPAVQAAASLSAFNAAHCADIGHINNKRQSINM